MATQRDQDPLIRDEHSFNVLTDTQFTNNKPNCRPRCKTLIVLFLLFLIVVTILSVLIAFEIIPNSLKKEPKKHHGIYGKWPSNGGKPSNQQIAPLNNFTRENIKQINISCVIKENNTLLYFGYITVDDDNNAYIPSGTGTIKKLDLNTCNVKWNVQIAQLIGYTNSDAILQQQDTVTLFKTSSGTKGVLIGSPSAGVHAGRQNIALSEPCWAVALNANDGSLLWKTNLGINGMDWHCLAHGFMVDENDHFAYGGVMNGWARSSDSVDFNTINRGRLVKIDINNGHIIDIWYPIDNDRFGFDIHSVNMSSPYHYRGVSIWTIPAIIGDYVLVGTGNTVTVPKYIEDCIYLEDYDALSLQDANTIDPCGNDRANVQFHKLWRCLQTGVYPSSFIILNRKSLALEAAIPLIGLDNHESRCGEDESGCMKFDTLDADVVRVAGYTDPRDDQLYAAVATKAGMFWVFEVPSGRTIIGKKVANWSFAGGLTWSIAIDEVNLIAIVTSSGGPYWDEQNQMFQTTLADGLVICEFTGSVHAINLTNGDTIWQMYNPWGTIGAEKCNDTIYEQYQDLTVELSCETEGMKHPSETVINVVTAPIDESERELIQSSSPQQFRGSATIVNDMAFIPSYGGDIFVHDLFNGEYIHTIKCPNRGMIKGGLTVIVDQIIVRCGADMVSFKL